MSGSGLIKVEAIQSRIYTLRNVQIILDRDLADFYAVNPIRLREQVKRNINRFPVEFMFQLTEDEAEIMVSQNAIPSKQHMGGHLPYVLNAIERKEIQPKQGVFFDGQVFDAYVFVSDLIKTAKKSIILIDNYVDESVLVLFSVRGKKVSLIILTKNVSDKLKLDAKKFNEQYPPLELKFFDKAHDRFMIIDEQTVYHFGASLKDLGKKWFAFSKMDISAINMLKEAGELL